MIPFHHETKSMNTINNNNKEDPFQVPARTLGASIGIIIILTILSRPLGFFREILTAAYFGTRLELDSFLLASSIPVFLCTILGGGLVQAIVPALSLSMDKGKDRGWELLTNIFYRTTLLAIPLTILNHILAPWIVPYLYPQQTPDQILGSGILVYRLLSLAIAGGMISGLFIGAANACHFYGHTTLRSVAYNIMIMLSLVLFHKRLGVFSLGLGILLAEYIQILVVLPPLWKQGYRFQAGSGTISEGYRLALVAFIPAILLNGMGHVNYLIDRILAMPLGEGCVSSLEYAWKLILMPVSLLSVAFATPLLSFLSRHEARKERDKTGALFVKTTGMLFFLAIPATFLLLLTRREMIYLIYGWGRFDENGVILTSWCLFFYSPGLPFQLVLPLCVAGFLAVRKPWIPVVVSLPLIPLNWLLDRLLMKSFLHAGIALSTSLIFLINVTILLLILQRQFRASERVRFTYRHVLFFICSIFFFISIWWAYGFGFRAPNTPRIMMVVELTMVGMITMSGYLMLSYVFQIQSLERIWEFFDSIIMKYRRS
jgi:putative peptidoglycan lipid II flippase